jgi:hypothetical protein
MKFDPAKAIQQLEQFGEFGGVNPSITDSSTFTFLGAKPWLIRSMVKHRGAFYIQGTGTL